MDTRKSKRRCMRSSTERQGPQTSAARGMFARLAACPAPDDVNSDESIIMNGPINIRLDYNPPPTICMDTDTMIRSSTVKDIQKQIDAKECLVCFDSFGETGQDIVTTPCEHFFHRRCLLESLNHSTNCPICRKSVATPRGKCPRGTMSVNLTNAYTSVVGLTPQVIQIAYSIPSGTQATYHESPGQRFRGASRIAYLLNDAESRRLLQRLCFAFMHGLTFTVGTSLTSGAKNTVTWASIHHKTGLGGHSFSLPDPGYVLNCNEELDNLNVPPSESCGPYF